MRIAVVFFALLLVSACSSRRVPGDIIPPDKMKPIVYDMIRADELVTSFIMLDTSLNSDEQRVKMYEQVFKVHNTSHAEFYKSFKYYQAHPNMNKVLFDSLQSYANRQQNSIQNHLRDTAIMVKDSLVMAE